MNPIYVYIAGLKISSGSSYVLCKKGIKYYIVNLKLYYLRGKLYFL